jgi:hypothetical protein
MPARAAVSLRSGRFMTLRQIDRRLHQLSLHPLGLRSDVWREEADTLLDARLQATR